MKTSRWARVLLTLLLMYVAPVLLIVTGVIPFKWRFHLLLIMAAAAGVRALSSRYALSSLGLTAPRLSVMAAWSVLPSLLLIAGIYLTDIAHRPFPAQRLPFYFFFVLVSCPAQEFLYRSFLFANLASLGVPSAMVILISALAFSFMHVIYRDELTVLFTFLVGIVWGCIFQRARSFYAVAFSHAVVGASAFLLGVV